MAHDIAYIVRMAKRPTTTGSRPARKPSSGRRPKVQRTYRFDREIFNRFEEVCARNLSNPKLVIEAALLHCLEADPKTRSALAERHLEFTGETGSGGD